MNEHETDQEIPPKPLPRNITPPPTPSTNIKYIQPPSPFHQYGGGGGGGGGGALFATRNTQACGGMQRMTKTKFNASPPH